MNPAALASPYAPPQADALDARDRDPRGRIGYSGLGLASLVLGVLSVLSSFGLFAYMIAIVIDNGMKPPSADHESTLVIGIVALLGFLITLLGLALGVAAVIQKTRSRTLGAFGLSLNGLVLVGWGLLFVLAALT